MALPAGLSALVFVGYAASRSLVSLSGQKGLGTSLSIWQGHDSALLHGTTVELCLLGRGFALSVINSAYQLLCLSVARLCSFQVLLPDFLSEGALCSTQ